MSDTIKHLGIVENINGPYVQVRILQTSACASCSVKGHCNASETKEKLIDVYNGKDIHCQIGQRVLICGTTSMGMKAVWLAFCIPFLLLVGALFLFMTLTGGDEAKAALCSLATLIPYYLILYMCRKRLSRAFTFTLESIN